MWPNTFNKKCATISGWQCLGDFQAVKQQLQKIRASTRIPSNKKGGRGPADGSGAHRPLPPLPGTDDQGAGASGGAQQGNKSVRFALPDGSSPGGPSMSGSEGSDQGYESDQSRERRRQLEMPGLLQRLAEGGGYGGTLNRYDDTHRHTYYGPGPSSANYSGSRAEKEQPTLSRDLSTSSPVLLQLYDAVKIEPEKSKPDDNVQAAIARLASTDNLSNSYDLVLGLVRRPHPSSPTRCRHGHAVMSTPPPTPRHFHCPCSHERSHHCREGSSRKPKSRNQSPLGDNTAGSSSKSRSRPSSPNPTTPSKSRWSFGKKAKRSASAERRPDHFIPQGVELGWGGGMKGMVGKWEDTGATGATGWNDISNNSKGTSSSNGNIQWEANGAGAPSADNQSAATTAQLAGDLCRRATALRRTLYKMPGLINHRHAFLEIIKDVASEMKLLLDAAGRLSPLLPEQQKMELDLARRKLLETSRSFSNALKGYFKDPQATPVLLAATALVYRTDEIIQALEP